MNDDGWDDIAVLDPADQTIGIFIQNPDASLSAMTTYTAPTVVNGSLAVGDLNGDGRNDLAVINEASSPSDLFVYYQNSGDTFDSPVPYSLGCAPSCGPNSVDIGDVTNDGRVDMVVAFAGEPSSLALAVFAQASDGSLQAPVL